MHTGILHNDNGNAGMQNYANNLHIQVAIQISRSEAPTTQGLKVILYCDIMLWTRTLIQVT